MRTRPLSLVARLAVLPLLAVPIACGSSGGGSGGSSLPPPAAIVATARFGYVDVTWDAVPGASGYVLYVAPVAGVGPANHWLVPSSEKRVAYETAATFGEFPGSSVRYVRVASLSGNEEGLLSGETFVLLPPDPPESLLATAGVGEVELLVARSTGASQYEVFLAADETVSSENWASLPEGRHVVTGLLPFRVTGLENGRSYAFVARASNAAGPSRDGLRVHATPSARGSFGTPVPFAVGAGPAAVATGDFDGDGLLDVATANSGAASVSVLRGDGDGALFGRVDRAVGAGPAGIAAGDLTGDGRPDLVVANADGGTVTVLRNDALGGFLAALTFPAGTRPVAVTLADFDRDSRVDVGVADATGAAFRYLRNTGGGVLAAPVGFAVGAGPTGVVSGDFDGDDFPDVALSAAGAGQVTTWFGNGTGGFTRRTDLPAGLDCRSVATGELNGDGRRDLAVLSLGEQAITVFFANSTGGFAPGIRANTPAGASTLLALADLDGDATLDVLLANAPTTNLSVLLGRPGPPYWHLADYSTSPLPSAVATADLDGDGALDAVVANSLAATVSVFLGRR